MNLNNPSPRFDFSDGYYFSTPLHNGINICDKYTVEEKHLVIMSNLITYCHSERIKSFILLLNI